MHANKIPVICLMGPTATGKTDAAACLYRAFDSEIVSVDSSLVYRGMNIGTAKPEAAFLAEYPHHLVDIRAPEDSYSVADFYADATLEIKRITKKGKVPILAGGTMFYFNALQQGLSELPQANPRLREQINRQAKQAGWASLHAKLAVLDPVRASKIEDKDAQRIQRALEIVLESGQAVTQHNSKRKAALPNPMLKIALSFSDRAYLHQRIEQRFDLMLEAGLKQEVQGLLDSGLSADCTSMKMIGYRQMLEFLKGGTTYSVMRSKGIAATRQLAKRQLTWLRNQPNVVWWVDLGLKQKEFSNLVDYVRHSLRQSAYTQI